MDIKSLTTKRIGKVPVLYIAAAFVLILAVVAYRMRSAPTADAVDPNATPDSTADLTDTSGSGDAGISAGDVYPQLPSGTVVATPSPSTDNTGNTAIETNEEWLKAAAFWLADQKGVSAGTAQAALSKYLNGDSLTYDEGQWRDAAVRQFGFPPDLTPTPVTGAKPAPPAPPALTQGPLPRRHIVKGANDNTLAKLATLYYGRPDTDKLQAANTNLGSLGSRSATPLPVGTAVYIPVNSAPKYFTATKTINTAQAIARANGISTLQLQALNDASGRPHYPLQPGQRVRVG